MSYKNASPPLIPSDISLSALNLSNNLSLPNTDNVVSKEYVDNSNFNGTAGRVFLYQPSSGETVEYFPIPILSGNCKLDYLKIRWKTGYNSDESSIINIYRDRKTSQNIQSFNKIISTITLNSTLSDSTWHDFKINIKDLPLNPDIDTIAVSVNHISGNNPTLKGLNIIYKVSIIDETNYYCGISYIFTLKDYPNYINQIIPNTDPEYPNSFLLKMSSTYNDSFSFRIYLTSDITYKGQVILNSNPNPRTTNGPYTLVIYDATTETEYYLLQNVTLTPNELFTAVLPSNVLPNPLPVGTLGYTIRPGPAPDPTNSVNFVSSAPYFGGSYFYNGIQGISDTIKSAYNLSVGSPNAWGQSSNFNLLLTPP